MDSWCGDAYEKSTLRLVQNLLLNRANGIVLYAQDEADATHTTSGTKYWAVKDGKKIFEMFVPDAALHAYWGKEITETPPKNKEDVEAIKKYMRFEINGKPMKWNFQTLWAAYYYIQKEADARGSGPQERAEDKEALATLNFLKQFEK